MEQLNNDTINDNDTTEDEAVEAPRLRTQKELFRELEARVHVMHLAEQAVEDMMREIADELSPTFRSEGYCEEYPDAPVLQIRERFNKRKGRKVPFFVPLRDLPSTWLGKKATTSTTVEDPSAVNDGVVNSSDTTFEVVDTEDDRIPEDDGIVVD